MRGRSGRPPARSNGQSTERATIPADVSGTGLGTESRHDASAPAPPVLRCRRNSEAMIWRTCGGAFVLARMSRESSTSELATTHRRPMPNLLSFVPARSTALRGGEGKRPQQSRDWVSSFRGVTCHAARGHPGKAWRKAGGIPPEPAPHAADRKAQSAPPLRHHASPPATCRGQPPVADRLMEIVATSLGCRTKPVAA